MLTHNTGPEHDSDHMQIIRQHYLFLVENLNANSSGLVDELYKAGVLNKEERDAINSEVTSFMQNAKLLLSLIHI